MIRVFCCIRPNHLKTLCLTILLAVVLSGCLEQEYYCESTGKTVSNPLDCHESTIEQANAITPSSNPIFFEKRGWFEVKNAIEPAKCQVTAESLASINPYSNIKKIETYSYNDQVRIEVQTEEMTGITIIKNGLIYWQVIEAQRDQLPLIYEDCDWVKYDLYSSTEEVYDNLEYSCRAWILDESKFDTPNICDMNDITESLTEPSIIPSPSPSPSPTAENSCTISVASGSTALHKQIIVRFVEDTDAVIYCSESGSPQYLDLTLSGSNLYTGFADCYYYSMGSYTIRAVGSTAECSKRVDVSINACEGLTGQAYADCVMVQID